MPKQNPQVEEFVGKMKYRFSQDNASLALRFLEVDSMGKLEKCNSFHPIGRDQD
ncbi:hypothetical protein C943_02068 [Mariniradius saccharolyticus AK6]|uniref:Uncharacterized protein n=1 Tax=Mariniradius saccharolyticus AK6 TaxID=1239962 RepID=M7X9W4_9BACT|nr:hypothetical protein C943_02068 [Mariniradius saccharolyticus AK6]